MSVQFRLDHVIERMMAEEVAEEVRLLKRLTGVRLKPSEARMLWPRVLEHKWYVSERLGRDVGLRVAAIDYLENVRLPRPSAARRKPTLFERLRRVMQPHGAQV